MSQTNLSKINGDQASSVPLVFCPCCLKHIEAFPVYFSNDMEALRCTGCGVAFLK